MAIEPVGETSPVSGPSAAVASAHPLLNSIWEAQHCKFGVFDGVKGWECLHCGFVVKARHHTRALAHFAKRRGWGIYTCKAVHTTEQAAQYSDLWNLFEGKLEKKKRTHEEQLAFAEHRQQLATEALKAKRSKLDSHYPVIGINSSTAFTESSQPSMEASLQNMSQQDIRGSNNAALELAIADFFHSENIPDSVVESKRFAIVLKKARLVGDDFKIPHRHKLGGELLDVNYKSCMSANEKSLMLQADTFGLAWIGDGATVKKMPLVNVLVTCGEVPPTVIAINDCTGHMAAGGKKDASFIAKMFHSDVDKYDKEKSLTDLFFFDGASNVQKAGQILTARYPRATCCHRGRARSCPLLRRPCAAASGEGTSTPSC